MTVISAEEREMEQVSGENGVDISHKLEEFPL